MSDDYLWDRSGQADPDVRELERLLGDLRHRGSPDDVTGLPESGAADTSAGDPRAADRAAPLAGGRRGARRWAAGLVAAAIVIAIVGIVSLDRNRPAWDVASLEGAPRVGTTVLAGDGRLRLGEWLETDGRSRAEIQVGSIGEVVVEPDSRIGLAAVGEDDHRLVLARGTIHAMIWAPPGKFFVETPSALAVDLGCAYTLRVDVAGAGELQVNMGWVAFEHEGRESFVPAEARCLTRPVRGPGTPWFEDASEELIAALARLDFGAGPLREPALETVLAEARPRDALTLWHLLSRVEPGERGEVHDRLAQLVPSPPGVTREGVVDGDRAMLDAWWNALGLEDVSWWRRWKGPVPGEGR